MSITQAVRSVPPDAEPPEAAPTPPRRRVRSRVVRGGLIRLLALALVVTAGLFTRAPSAGEAQLDALAGRFSVNVLDANGDPPVSRTIRTVEPSLRNIQAWISSVGAGGGLADFNGDGLPNERCLVDPRDDSVTIGGTPERPGRLAPFALRPDGLYYNARITAPMGCLPADLNEDGSSDVLVYFWGRPPLVYLRKPGSALDPSGFVAADITDDPGQLWNSTTANTVDLDGDGHLDVFVGNYFPDGARVLDPDATGDSLMRMHASMSASTNGGRNAILRYTGSSKIGGVRVPRFTDVPGVLDNRQAKSWTLATGAQDLDADGLPELYVANDFGPDYLLHNESVPGTIRFRELRGRRDAFIPKSKVLGSDSFKSMGVAFTDLNRDGRADILVSNITTEFGLQESNFAFTSTDTGPLTGGVAPYRDNSEALGLSRSGWAWDIKAFDADGDGQDEVIQALGFFAGDRNRWALLQELAMANDVIVRYPALWPRFKPGDDIAGDQRDPFFARGPQGRFFDVGDRLGIRNAGPTRGIAVGDVDHDGKADVLLANQFARSQLVHNTGAPRRYLGLKLLVPGADGALRPAVGATATVVRRDGVTLSSQLYPANGHTGVNAPELLFGLDDGRPAGDDPVAVAVSWRDGSGLHHQAFTLAPGWHTVTLGA